MNFPLLQPNSSAEFSLRLSKAREAMARAGADAMLLATSVNLFYLTGGVFRGYVYISSETKDPAVFMIPPAACDSPLVRSIRKPENIPAELRALSFGKAPVVALEKDELSFNEVMRLAALFSDATILDASDIMREARMVKTEAEISLMREDGRRQTGVYSRIGHLYSEDMSDLELQIRIEQLLRSEGSLGYLRVAGRRMELNMGSVIAGSNADVPSPYDFSMGGAGFDPSLPVGASGMLLEPGMTVMVDVNGNFNGYQTDMTRVWSVGEVPALAHDAHRCSIAILRDLEKFAVPGVEIGELYRRSLSMVQAAGLAEYFMGHAHRVPFIGHGVGIELNERPVVMERNKMKLLENMTLALEPKFVIPGVGAVGVENTYAVRRDGLENLTVLDEELREF